MQETKPEEHHINGPSTLDMRGLCPGSGYMEINVPEVETEDSTLGRELHQVMRDNDNFSQAQGYVYTGQNYWKYLKEEHLPLIESCFSVLDKLPSPEYSVQQKEFFVRLDIKGKRISYGTMDQFIYSRETKTCYIIDWKFLYGEYELPQYNKQIITYAVGWDRRSKFEPEKYILIMHHPSLHKTHTCEFTREELYDRFEELKIVEIINTSQNCIDTETPILRPSRKACKHCKASSFCPAFRGWIQKQAKNIAKEFEDKEYITDAMLVNAYEFYKNTEMWGKPINLQMKERLKKGGKMAGYRISRHTRTYIDDSLALYENIIDSGDKKILENVYDMNLSKVKQNWVSLQKQYKSDVDPKKAVEEFEEKYEKYLKFTPVEKIVEAR